MTDSDLTVSILREIRDEIKANRTETVLVRTELGARIEHLSSRVDVTTAISPSRC